MIASVAELTKQSGFVFEGTVSRMGEETPPTAIVHVERILKGPEVLSRFEGQEVSILLREHEAVHAKARAIFFTNGFRYGVGLTVREVGRLDATGRDMKREVREAMEQAKDDELLKCLRESRLVVSGTVVQAGPHEHRERTGTEHDPEWWECVIDVATVEKGTVKAGKNKAGKNQVVAYFAHSTDVAWYRAPKLREGDSGLFILHEGEFRSRPTPGPALIHPVDFRPMEEVERVRELVKRVE